MFLPYLNIELEIFVWGVCSSVHWFYQKLTEPRHIRFGWNSVFKSID